MNTVGPYHNRQETYNYFSLPFCVGSKESISHYHETLSEALQGVELEISGIDMDFKSKPPSCVPQHPLNIVFSKANVAKTEYCAVQLDEAKYKAFVYAVKNHYWYQMYIDDLPIWGVVGEVKDNNFYIWTHKKFEIGKRGFGGNGALVNGVACRVQRQADHRRELDV